MGGGSGPSDEFANILPHFSQVDSSVPVSSGKKSRRNTHVACVNCSKWHVSCEAKRPCHRCVVKGLGSTCVDAPRKKSKYLAGVPDASLIRSVHRDNGSQSNSGPFDNAGVSHRQEQQNFRDPQHIVHKSKFLSNAADSEYSILSHIINQDTLVNKIPIDLLYSGKPNDNYDDDDDAAIESFQQSVENLVNNGVTSREELVKNLKPQRKARPETVVVCLTRSSHMLELVNMSLEQNILITSLIDSLITPAVRNTEPKIRELGVRNLGLCCLLDVQLATESMYILGMCVSKGNASLKKIALQVIVDIFSVHGSRVVDGEGKVDSISLHKIFYKVLKNDDLPDCQVVAAEGLCKLFLADVFTDDDLFETLVLSYFSPVNSNNEPLIQAFAFCIPVYCFSHSQHQERMAKIATDVLLRLCMLWEDLQEDEDEEVDRDAMLKPNIIFQQLLHWTDPRKLINRSEEEAAKDNVQLTFMLDFSKAFSKIERKDIKKMLLTNINAAFISSGHDYGLLKELGEHLDDIVENENLDTVSLNSLQKFKITLDKIKEEAHEKSNINKDELDSSDEQYSQILESSIHPTDHDGGNEHSETSVPDEKGEENVTSKKADEPKDFEISSGKKRTRSEREEDSNANDSNNGKVDSFTSDMSVESQSKNSELPHKFEDDRDVDMSDDSQDLSTQGNFKENSNNLFHNLNSSGDPDP